MLEALSAADARRWAVLTRAAFAARRAEIDALNVYPVPDGDTGTNLYLSLDAALDAVRTEQEKAGILGAATLAQECSALARSLLLTARGNSGVIFSQLVRGFAEAIAESGAEVADARTIADGMAKASDRAYRSVTRPAEGTILTVARAAAEAGAAVVDAGLVAVTERALDAATEALRATTGQLPALERAGVVDAGAAGYLLLLEALARVVHQDEAHVGERMEPFAHEDSMRRRDDWSQVGGVVEPTGATGGAPAGADLDPGGPAYEVMYLLRDSDDERAGTLRDTLDELGDSLLVVGGPDLWNIHVHVDDVGAAIEAGLEAGRPYRIRVTHFVDQLGQHQRAGGVGAGGGVGVVACAAGPGLAEVFRAAGAVVVASGPGRRASAGQLLDAARSTRADEVVVLPNDADTVMAAEAAASAAAQDGLTLHVVGSRTAVQGLAALAVFDAAASGARNGAAMGAAAAATRHGAVAVASKEALTSAGRCQAGDVLGAVAGDVVVIGHDLADVALDVVARLLSSGGELVTLVMGADADEELADALAERVSHAHREVEVSVIQGGQPHYPVLVGVE
ncbi:DAK2 domain-containing protein [Nostocoides sp. HKS02]|uniref:DAK2 domain-containing protein n=1 Tax=Nostocoides sp. HKS02 TaxID=1813880 RepID=UPI0012B4443D|nr:DAK2 domain-containing protein [Tetrasphaera sp. HKS02]QGN57856.1 DAK2 domain-containing protein [Tetrasphaera sp. HKS02]